MPDILELIKSLSDETRFNLIRLLLEQDCCVGAIAIKLNISESAASQHLKVLRMAGLVNGDKRGYFTHYSVDRESLKWAAKELIRLSETKQQTSLCARRSKS